MVHNYPRLGKNGQVEGFKKRKIPGLDQANKTMPNQVHSGYAIYFTKSTQNGVGGVH